MKVYVVVEDQVIAVFPDLYDARHLAQEREHELGAAVGIFEGDLTIGKVVVE